MIEDCKLTVDCKSKSDVNEKYTFVEIEKQHLKQLKIMVLSMFPIAYDDYFYKEILTWPLKRMAFERNTAIGALCAKVEEIDGVQKVYIAILGVMVFWRGYGIGKMLLDFVETYCKSNPAISSIYLHVQKDNVAAQDFYSRFGFVSTSEIQNFYRRTSCPTAVVMEKLLL